MVQEVLIIKEKCKKCGNEFDETEYMQFLTSLEKKGDKNGIEDVINQIACPRCYNENIIGKKGNYADAKAV